MRIRADPDPKHWSKQVYKKLPGMVPVPYEEFSGVEKDKKNA